MNKKLAACALLLLSAGCASTDGTTTDKVAPHEREYTTGSNLQRRPQQGPSEVKTVSGEELERNANRGNMPVPR